jgi:REP element-mobilizing transposase RayT
LPEIPQHIIQRGNNRQVCFNSDQDMVADAGWLKEVAGSFGLAIHDWVFISNHVHFLATPYTATEFPVVPYLGRLYVRYTIGNTAGAAFYLTLWRIIQRGNNRVKRGQRKKRG